MTLLVLVATPALLGGEPESPLPQRQLGPMLKIDWSRGPNLPQGFQDSDGGFLGTSLITACGFCSGGLPEDNRQKPGRYPRGFLQNVWSLDVAAAKPQWQAVPAFPGTARQGLFSGVVGDSLYLWGGFSYTEPFCYADGWQLTRTNDNRQWRGLPPLPWKLTSGAMGTVGTKLYVAGGADYDGLKGFYTENDRAGQNARLGAHLLTIDTGDLGTGWKKLPDCPGTPRFVHTLQAVRGKLFLIGGATGDLIRDGKSLGYCTVVDNWMFDPATERWARLRDLPVSSGNFPKSSNLVYDDRYIVLPGGHQYANVANPDGTVRAKYGTASQKRPASGLHNDVFVYDTLTNLFGNAQALPIDNNLPMSVVRGDRIYLLGGETGGGFVEGEYYGHHPDLLLIGRISGTE